MDIRNFCIIAHIDHGKSTLADRMLEVTGTVSSREMREQYLDGMDLERERGITIKLQPVRMQHKGVQLNLIDTPGHTDFRYEVSRSLAACEGAILLVDASQGIQAQTLAVLYMAMENSLTIIPVLNKIDLPAADPEGVGEELVKLLGCLREEVLEISAKEGRGVQEVLLAVIDRIPAPARKKGKSSAARALIFDTVMDRYQGAVAYIRVKEGELKKGQRVFLLGTGYSSEITEIGHFSPMRKANSFLKEGEIGYVITGAKDVLDVRTGDTIASEGSLQPLPGYHEVQPMVFASIFPTEADAYPQMKDALEKLSFNDSAFSAEPERNAALGNGFRCGFLGLLHMDIIQERLEREYDCDLIITAPSVLYEVQIRSKNPASVVRSSMLKSSEPDVARISNPADVPDSSMITEIREPWVRLEILCREQDVGSVMTLLQDRRGVYQDLQYLDAERTVLRFEVPLQAIILDFFDALKSATAGFGSMSYKALGYRAESLVKLQILLLGDPVDALSIIVHKSEAHEVGKLICKKLKKVLPKAQYVIPIQAAIGGKIVARETLSAMRKDVTSGLYGGDVTRKKKVLEKQKKGKKRLKSIGKVQLPQEAFLVLLKR